MIHKTLLALIFQFIHSDIISTRDFEINQLDLAFIEVCQKNIDSFFLRKYVRYKIEEQLSFHIELENPLIIGNSYIPFKFLFQTHMFSDCILMALHYVNSTKLQKYLRTYKKVLIRKFIFLQETGFNSYNDFIRILKKTELFYNIDNYDIYNHMSRALVIQFIQALKRTSEIPFFIYNPVAANDLRPSRILDHLYLSL